MDINRLDLDNYGLTVLNFADIFQSAYVDIVKDLFTYDKFHDHNVRSQDTKRIYYYHMVKHTCDVVKDTKSDNKIVIYYSEKDVKCDFPQVTNKRTRNTNIDRKPEFVLFINRFFKQIKHIIPVRVYLGDVKFMTFVQYYNTNKGKYLETINNMRTIRQKRNFDFEKFKSFTRKFKLNYLTEQYINHVKVKSIMYK